MKFVCIFESKNGSLFAYQMVGAKKDLFSKAFDTWKDTSYLYNFFEKNIKDLYKWKDKYELVEAAVIDTVKERDLYHSRFLKVADKTSGIKLDSMFNNLHSKTSDEVELIEKKSYGTRTPTWLRIYAIKLEDNCYLVTGFMIKLKKKMQDTKAGQIELKNIKSVKNFLKVKKIKTKQDLINYINER